MRRWASPRTVQSILRAGILPADVYVIDDGSSDGTGDIARSFDVNVVQKRKEHWKGAQPGAGWLLSPNWSGVTTTSA